MIRATVKQLEQRCAERGYTLEQVYECIVQQNADGSIMVDTKSPKYPHPRVISNKPGESDITPKVKPARRYLGDVIGDGLASIGITPERVSNIVGSDCGCNKRKEKLNELHKKALNIMRPKNAK
jgi:hypothetical protein